MGYAHSHRWSNPSLGTASITGERYTSTGFMEREWNHIWSKVWLLVARAADIPDSGDFMVEDIGTESFVTVRQHDGSLQVFLNHCPYKGCLLYTSPSPRDRTRSRMPSSA